MMRDCEDGAMRDLLPDYVNDTLSEAEHAKVEAHLRACADCAAEIEVIEAAGRAYPAPRMDVDRIMKAIPTAGSKPRRFNRVLALAAGIGVLVFGAMRLYLASPEATVAKAPIVSPAPTIMPPRTATIESTVVAAAPAQVHAPAASAARRGASISFGGGLDDLSDDQLAALLSELDTLEALPSTEPETHLSPIVPDAGGGSNAR